VQVHGASCTSTAPIQLRVALRGPNGITISWSTSGTSGSNDTPSPQVIYGTSSTLLNGVSSTIGTTSNYTTASFFHNVPLLNLSPSTKYYYRTVAATCVNQSSIYSFTTPPAAGNSNPVTITFVADLGASSILDLSGAAATIKALNQIASSTNFFVHNGDISYADDVYFIGGTYEGIWNTFQNNMQNITAQNIYMTGPGNHEVTCNQNGDSKCLTSANIPYRNFSAYLNRFRMPGNESGGFQNLWYSFDYGLVHVTVINTETDFTNAPAGPNTTLNGGNFEATGGQLAWFQNDLQTANANRANVPWIVVTGHRPFFSSVTTTVQGNCSACGTAFIPYILQYNVDIYIAGHVHWYERLYPINANGIAVAHNYTNTTGFIHITNGAGGASEGSASLSSSIAASAKVVTGYGYSQLQILNRSTAVLTFYSTSSSKSEDSQTIIRPH
jgi:hypothetical protein